MAFTVLDSPTPSLADCAPPRLENTIAMEPFGKVGEVAVPISLNGVEKKFLLDTGGGALNYISRSVAQELKLTELGGIHTMDLKGGESDRSVDIDDVRFGAFEARHIRFQLSQDLDSDGIFSTGTLPHDDLDFDFGNMRLNVFSRDHCAGDVVYWPHQALAVVPVETERGYLELTVTLDGHELRAALDTGASWTNLNLARAEEKMDFSPDHPAPPSGDAPKDEPNKQTYYRRYSALAFGGVTVTNPLVIVRPLQFGGLNDRWRARYLAAAANRAAPDIIIGMEVLRRLHLYYAAGEHKLYITPASLPQPPENSAPPSNAPAPAHG